MVRDATPRRAFAAGILFGVLFCLGIAYWVYLAVAAYFPLPSPLALLCTLASYGVFIGFYTGLAAALAALLMRCPHPLLRMLGVPASWVVGEFARSTVYSGFSWQLLGYTQHQHLALIQIADLTGVYGVSFLLACSSYVAAEIIRSFYGSRSSSRAFRFPPFALRTLSFPWTATTGLTALVAATLSYGAFRLADSPVSQDTAPVTLVLVKANVPSAHRWQRVRYASTLLAYAQASRQHLGQTQPDLVIWPEFALGFYLNQEPSLRVLLNQLTHQLNAPLLLGAPRAESGDKRRLFYNSAYLLAPGGAILDVYDKMRLLPFAESWPSFFPSVLAHRPETPTEFTAGSRATVFSLPQGQFGVLICYEATYPVLARRLVQEGAHFLVNISNDTWLAGEAASAQHFSMAVFRAVENRRFLARVATAGVSGFIDPFGRPTQQSIAPEASLLGTVTPQRRFSVYTRYGDWFVGLCGGLALGIVLLTRARATAFTSEGDQGATLRDAFVVE